VFGCVCVNVHILPCLWIEHLYSHAVRHTNTHWQDMRFSSIWLGGRVRRQTTAVRWVWDSRTPRPAGPLPIAGLVVVVGHGQGGVYPHPACDCPPAPAGEDLGCSSLKTAKYWYWSRYLKQFSSVKTSVLAHAVFQGFTCRNYFNMLEFKF
jgi:hypothetical protein